MVRTLHDAELDISEDERFQRGEWAVQRVAWALAAAVLVIAAAGFFGDGPASEDVLLGDGARVQYQRTARRERPLQVVVAIEARREAPVVELTGGYFERAEIESVSPRPEAEEAIEGGVRYRFRAGAGADVNRITIRLRPRGAGWHRGAVSAGGESFKVSMFVYP